MNTLSSANKEIEKAGETDREEETEEDIEKNGQKEEAAAFMHYTPVDVRL